MGSDGDGERLGTEQCQEGKSSVWKQKSLLPACGMLVMFSYPRKGEKSPEDSPTSVL